MADEAIDQKLRDMAEHRGFKLVKSRRRKPGVGDFGKFGLTDGAGKALLGIGDEGVEASADEIESYLRAGAASTWKQSAESTSADPRPRRTRDPENDPGPAPAIRPRATRSANDKTARVQEPAAKSSGAQVSIRSKGGKPTPKSVAKETPPPPTPAEPKLLIRAAKSGDSAALLPLLKQLNGVSVDELTVARNFRTALKANAGMIVAVLGRPVGCCAWAILPTIQHGLVGRLTVLLVAEDHRRKGVATAMLAAAVAVLDKAGCKTLEAMSDIEVKNAHNFFRTLKFEQTSYRFARPITFT